MLGHCKITDKLAINCQNIALRIRP